MAEKNIRLFTRYGIFSERELRSRYDIQMENYAKVVRIEGATLLEMAQRSILPAMIRYQKELLEVVANKRALGIDDQVETALAGRLSDGCIALNAAACALSEALGKLPVAAYEAALHCKEAILPAMGAVRKAADALEALSSKDAWPLPSYEELLFTL